MLNFNKFVRLEFLEKTLPLPKHVDIIVSSMTQTLGKWDSHVLSGLTFEWYEDAMVFCVFMFVFHFFCLEATLGEDT